MNVIGLGDMKQIILSFSGLEFVTVGLVGCRGSKPCAKLPLLCTKIIKQVKRNKKSEIGDIIIIVNLYPNEFIVSPILLHSAPESNNTPRI